MGNNEINGLEKQDPEQDFVSKDVDTLSFCHYVLSASFLTQAVRFKMCQGVTPASFAE
jgi:hypothetical protein